MLVTYVGILSVIWSDAGIGTGIVGYVRLCMYVDRTFSIVAWRIVFLKGHRLGYRFDLCLMLLVY